MENKNLVAFVTGGSRGIGRAIAVRLAEDGFDVAITYVKDEESAKEVVEEIKKRGVNAIALKCDVSNYREVEITIEKVVHDLGSIDVVVNNAGITKDNLILKMEENEWDRVTDVNLKGAFNVIKFASKYMIKKRKGKIINISSVVGLMGNVGQANYAASKAGLIGLTKSVAKELAARGITVNAVAPGFIETDMTRVLKEDIKETMLKSIPLKRAGKPEEVAEVVAFLASKASDYITGQVINIDGGMVM